LFVRDGLAAGGPALIAVPRERLGLLRAALAGAGEAVEFTGMTVPGRNPARIIPAIGAFAARPARAGPGSPASRCGPGAAPPRPPRRPGMRR
jgi:hypothetical protein